MELADLESLGNEASTAYKTGYSFSDFKPSKAFRERFKEVYENHFSGSFVTAESSSACVTTSTNKTFDIPYSLFMRSYFFMDFAIKFKEYSKIAGGVLAKIPQEKWSKVSKNELTFKTAIFDILEESKPNLTLPVNEILTEWKKSLIGDKEFIFTDFIKPISELKSSMDLTEEDIKRLFHFISDREWSHTGKSPLRMGGLISAVMGLMSVVQAKQGAIEDALEILTLDDDLVELLNESVNSRTSSTNNETKKLNQILYGPPGTGKTYHTINRAIEILDADFYKENIDEDDGRTRIKQRFDEMKEEGQIGFVTFHQSFSYEDFVEGLRAEANEEDGGINYFVQPGIFKKMCRQARKGSGKNSIDEAISKFMEHVEEHPVTLKTSTGKEFTVTYRGGRTFRIKPASSDKDYDYAANIENIKGLFHGSIDTYNRSYVLGILEHLKTDFDLGEEVSSSGDKSPVVLIIDEINRGNTASIFGELITLIETSKRAGMKEELSVTLPYSHEKFTVPNNLYIIGTMNTADRSLSHIDTALRRRFVFEEMMPETKLFESINVEGVDIQKMLIAINERIEILYDREHTLGHSFFLGLSGESKIEDLGHIFDMKILPLLEEYFFEDWEKIRLVLNDNNKSTDASFIVKKYDDKRLIELFGDEHHQYSKNVSYMRNKDALTNPDSYIKIYSSLVAAQD